MSLFSRALRRLDSWVNTVTGIGVGQGRTSFAWGQELRPDDQTLEDVYHGDPFASRICRVVPSEALRQGYRINCGDPEVETRLQTKLDTLLADRRIVQAWTWARVFGGGAVFIGADDGLDPAEPLDELALRDVLFLVALDKREMIPSRWYRDPLSAKFGEVEVYRFARAGGVGVDTREVHETRLLRFEGMMTTRRRRIMLQGWGESELARVANVLQQFNGNYAAVSTLVQDSSQGVFGLKGLYEAMAADAQDALKKRMELMDLSRSVAKSILIDKDEETFTRIETATLTGLADVMDKFALMLAGAAEIPVSLLLGQAPAGLNATGDSDIRWFYDRIRTEQNAVLRPALERLVRLVMRADDGPTGGLEPAKWGIDFNPLWQMSAQEQANTRKVVADTDAVYIGQGVLTPEEVAINRFRPEGWSPETSLDLAARKAVVEAETAAAEAVAGQGAEGAPSVEMKEPTTSSEVEASTPGDLTEGGLKAEPLPAPAASQTIWTPPEPKGGPAGPEQYPSEGEGAGGAK